MTRSARSLSPADYPPTPFPEAVWAEFVAACAESVPGWPVTADHRRVLEVLHAHLVGVNAWFNLTRITGPADFLHRHVLDSLLGLREPVLATAAADGWCFDLGAGAGYPGLPLALWHPGPSWIFNDSRRRKVDFLRAAAGPVAAARTGAIACRAFRAGEARCAAPELVGVCRVVVSRATGPAAKLLAEARWLLGSAGHLVLYKGPAFDAERPEAERAAEACGFHLERVHTLGLTASGDRRRLVVFRKEA